LLEGWKERQRHAAINRAEIIATIINANRWDDSHKAIEDLAEILPPWYAEYAGDGRRQESDYIVELPEPIDESIPQVERMTTKILKSKGIDPEEIDRESDEWREAEEIATRVLDMTKGTGDMIMLQGVPVKKADPKIWGEFPDW
jgi:hypothetical protein